MKKNSQSTKQKTSFSTWIDFINFKGSFKDKLDMLKSSLPSLGSPSNYRQLVWVALIDPDFSAECIRFYRTCPQSSSLPLVKENKLKKILDHPVPDPLLKYFEKEPIYRMLKLLALKRPDIDISFGMQYIAAVFSSIFSVEIDAFTAFCHTIENIFPAEFFHIKNRWIGLYQELRIFELMAEKMRPKLLNSLKSVFKENSVSKNSISPFVNAVKNIGKVWFLTLFTTTLPYGLILRFFDVFLVAGIDFLHRFSLAYLSYKEKFLINSIKSETKNLKLGSTTDALIIAGNLTKKKLLSKPENIEIEDLIKKALKKPSYSALNRFDYLSTAVILESKMTERFDSIKFSKNLIKNQPLDTRKVIEICESFSEQSVSRQRFSQVTQEIANWASNLSNKVYTLIDEDGEEQLDKSFISIALCVIVDTAVEERLDLCFNVFDRDKSGWLSSSELVEMVMIIEHILDGRSSFYFQESESLLKVFDSNGDSKVSLEEFRKTVTSNKIFKPILKLLNIFDINNVESIETIPQEFEEIHSQINETENSVSNISELAENEGNELVVPEYAAGIESQEVIENNEEGLSSHIVTGDLDNAGRSEKGMLEEIKKQEEVEEIKKQEGVEEVKKKEGVEETGCLGNKEESKGLKGSTQVKALENRNETSEEQKSEIEQRKNDSERFGRTQNSDVVVIDDLDIPQAKASKDRDCARLCTNQSCLLF